MNITRRGFLQGAIGLAGAGMTTALAVPALKTLLPPLSLDATMPMPTRP